MTTITLYGQLGDTVGTEWKLFVRSVAEALRAIEAQTDKLYKFFYEQNEKVEYRIIINGKDHESIGDLSISADSFETIEIVPVPAGSGGLWQTIIGVALIIVAVVAIVYSGGIAAGIGFGLTASIVSSLALNVGLIGLSLALGGVAQMMTKTPQAGAGSLARSFKDDPSQTKDPRLPSYLFSGATNTTRQGNVVPVGYGRLIVGSQLISFGLSRSSLSQIISSDQHPPGPNAPFLGLPVWATIAADETRTRWIRNFRSINKLTKRQLISACYQFNLIPDQTHTQLGVPTMRNLLYYESYLFSGQNGTQESLSFRQVRAIYVNIGSPGDIELRTASWQDLAVSIATFYSENPAPAI